jgi:hypothetical protein
MRAWVFPVILAIPSFALIGCSSTDHEGAESTAVAGQAQALSVGASPQPAAPPTLPQHDPHKRFHIMPRSPRGSQQPDTLSGPDNSQSPNPPDAGSLQYPPGLPPTPLPVPHLTYYGGRVVSNAQIVQVDWGAGPFQGFVSDGELGAFYAGITNSRFFDWLSEYDTASLNGADGFVGSGQHIGRGTFGGTFTITPINTSTALTDEQIEAELAQQIANNHLPHPTLDAAGNPNTIYFLHFPQGTTEEIQGITSCSGFCAYHSTFALEAEDIFYAVIPDTSPGSGCETCINNVTPLQNVTVIASHELVETVTDAEIGLHPSTITFNDAGLPLLRPAAWYDDNIVDIFSNEGGEIGDICQVLSYPHPITDSNGASWLVQRMWSNFAGECVISHLANGGFEGTAAPWTLTGTAALTSQAHSGSSAIMLGSPTGAPTGDSSASQTFDLPDPVGGGTVGLSFWYNVTCPTGGGGQISANITDVTTGASLGNLLFPSCFTSSGYVNVGNLYTSSHGHTITVTFTNHDDVATNFPQRTFALFDDVTPVVNPPDPGNVVLNGSFEAGGLTLPSWTTVTGAARSVPYFRFPAFTGRHSAMTGTTTPAAGDSTISQTFTPQLGFFGVHGNVYIVCPDVVTDDWVTATLQDLTAGTSRTILAKTCSNTGTYRSFGSAVTAGHTYTLTLSSHDDGEAGTATYALWDDIASF